MRAKDIAVGSVYTARVSGNLVQVRVTDIDTVTSCRRNGYSGQTVLGEKNIYRVVSLKTGRQLTFRSAQKFRSLIQKAGAS